MLSFFLSPLSLSKTETPISSTGIASIEAINLSYSAGVKYIEDNLKLSKIPYPPLRPLKLTMGTPPSLNASIYLITVRRLISYFNESSYKPTFFFDKRVIKIPTKILFCIDKTPHNEKIGYYCQ